MAISQHLSPTFSHHSSFNANCTWRAVVEVLVMAPAVPDNPVGVNVINAGVLKLARFVKLKISARNWRLQALAQLGVLDGGEVPRCQARPDKIVARGIAEESAVRPAAAETRWD